MRLHDRAVVDMPHLEARCGRPHNGLVVCTVTGEVDLVTASALRKALSRAERTAVSSVVVDLSEVEFLAAVGVALLVEAARRAARDGRQFTVLVASGPVRRVLEVTEADRELTWVRRSHRP